MITSGTISDQRASRIRPGTIEQHGPTIRSPDRVTGTSADQGAEPPRVRSYGSRATGRAARRAGRGRPRRARPAPGGRRSDRGRARRTAPATCRSARRARPRGATTKTTSAGDEAPERCRARPPIDVARTRRASCTAPTLEARRRLRPSRRRATCRPAAREQLVVRALLDDPRRARGRRSGRRRGSSRAGARSRTPSGRRGAGAARARSCARCRCRPRTSPRRGSGCAGRRAARARRR